jgi:hypothetical protein
MKNFKSYFPEIIEESKAIEVAKGINKAIVDVDDSLSYKDFAEAVAAILIEDYGTHNFSPFMEVLHARLGMNIDENKSEN